MDNTCPADNKIREIAGKSIREATERGLNREETITLIRENVRQGFASFKKEVREEQEESEEQEFSESSDEIITISNNKKDIVEQIKKSNLKNFLYYFSFP